QIRQKDLEMIFEIFEKAGISHNHIHSIGQVLPNEQSLIFKIQDGIIFKTSRVELQRIWSETSFYIQSLRDNATCAQEEFDSIIIQDDPGLHFHLTFDPNDQIMHRRFSIQKP